jgi:monoamine oxidase
MFGAGSLVDAMVRGLPNGTLRHSDPVSTLVRRDDHWVVASASGSTSCRHVVVALPPALAAETITFDPPLPPELHTLSATTPVWMGATTKAAALFDHCFWRSSGLSGSAMSHVGPLRELHDMSGPEGAPAALFGFGASSPDHPISPEDVVEQLARMFGPQARSASRVELMDWARERYTSPTNVRALTNYETFGHRLYQVPMFDGTVHWASTETAQAQPGHIEGALAAAERCVTNILRHESDQQMNRTQGAR